MIREKFHREGGKWVKTWKREAKKREKGLPVQDKRKGKKAIAGDKKWQDLECPVNEISVEFT